MIEFVTQGPRYAGPDRRRSERRRRGDRREEIRYEPAKEDRRSGNDRRGKGSWDNVSRRD
jgi:hypothetical protein